MSAARWSLQLGGNGRPNPGGWYRAICPGHGAGSQASLSLKDGRGGRLIVKCFGNCTPQKVLATLRALPFNAVPLPPPGPKLPASDPAERRARALELWDEAQPIQDSLAATYLRHRGVTMALPSSLRFHRSLFHLGARQYHPALVAMVRNVAGDPIAIHRTWLTRDGYDKADVTPNRMALGPISGGAVRLGEGGDTLILAEGVETSLSISQLYGAPAWATLSTSGLAKVNIPRDRGYREIIIAADHDTNGAGIYAAEKLRQRLQFEFHKVRVLKPKTAGFDFNDVLLQASGGII